MELYLLNIGIIHRLLCYQKRCRVRLNYPWKELWRSLIGLLKFLVYQEQNLVKKSNIFHLAIQVNIFQYFSFTIQQINQTRNEKSMFSIAKANSKNINQKRGNFKIESLKILT
jgi:hypothetical protein